MFIPHSCSVFRVGWYGGCAPYGLLRTMTNGLRFDLRFHDHIALVKVYPCFSPAPLRDLGSPETLALPLGGEEDRLQGLLLIASVLLDYVPKG